MTRIIPAAALTLALALTACGGSTSETSPPADSGPAPTSGSDTPETTWSIDEAGAQYTEMSERANKALRELIGDGGWDVEEWPAACAKASGDITPAIDDLKAGKWPAEVSTDIAKFADGWTQLRELLDGKCQEITDVASFEAFNSAWGATTAETGVSELASDIRSKLGLPEPPSDTQSQ